MQEKKLVEHFPSFPSFIILKGSKKTGEVGFW